MFCLYDSLKTEITDISTDGDGIGRVDGFAFFIKGAMPGDSVEFQITKLKKNYGYGAIKKIIAPSPFRVQPNCGHEQFCGGCSLQSISYDAQLNIKTKTVNDCLERIGGFSSLNINKTIGMEKPYYYRNKAEFFVSGNSENPVIGLYSQKTHDVLKIDDCCIQHPVNNKILKCVYNYIIEAKASIYNEKTGFGLVRSIITKVGTTTNEIMVCIVINGDSLPKETILINELIKISGMKSICLIKNKDRNNVKTGKNVIFIWGEEFITDYIDDIKFVISPQSFFQVNPQQTNVLYKKAIDCLELSGSETVIDAYCGIGSITLLLSKKCKKVYGLEIVPEAIADAKTNAKNNKISNCEFMLGKSEELLPMLYKDKKVKPDAIVIDPPRKGCCEKFLDALTLINPQKIVYISCNPSTMARDIKYICKSGYEIKYIQPVDMFPQTMHVETYVLLSHKNQKPICLG